MRFLRCNLCKRIFDQQDKSIPLKKECPNCGFQSLMEITDMLTDNHKDLQSLPVDGGGMRSNSGKVPISLCPNSTIYAISKVMEFGSHKYEPNNWRRGMKWSIPYDCAMRHLTTWFDGDTLDSESKLNHLYHVAANIAMLIEYEKTFADGDDRPVKFNPRKKEEM